MTDLNHFTDLRDSMRSERIGSGGRDVCQALSSALDRAIVALVDPVPDEVAIVALGGYGRGEMSPFSDIDLMVLHQGDDASEIAAELFRPLWDARFRVGHSVRTLKEAAAAAKERFDTQTTLLTGRLVSGDEVLFGRLMDEVAAVTRARPLRRYLVDEDRRRREAEPYLLMEANLKEGRGGLRTLQGFEWERRREDMIGRFTTDPTSEEAEAHEALLAIRNGLHVAAGRAHDVFSIDLREPVARWLGMDLYDTAKSLVSATQTVDRLAMARWPEVADEPAGPLGKRLWARLSGRPGAFEATRPPNITEINWMLDTGEQGRLTFERLWARGLLSELLPEWENVRCEPQLAPFHEHPVDAHLWRTVDEMRSLTTDGGRYEQVADSLERGELLAVCAFLHDIGKGHGGNHAEVGADIATRFCERLGLDEETTDLVEGAVRHHLLLSETATRRDLDDPAVIGEVAGIVGDLDLARVLYLLTVADWRATGPTMWSEWKATLLETLYDRLLVALSDESGELAGPSSSDVIAAAGERGDDVARHLEGMPEDYLRSLQPADVLWHLDLIESLDGASTLGVRSDGPVETAVVVGSAVDRFRQKVAGTFAANGVDVVEARLYTRADGLVVDSFQVRDDRTGGRVRPERWEAARADLESALRGELDTVSKVEARAAAYPVGGDDLKPSTKCSVDPATGDVVVAIRCSDRIGRLAEILDVMAAFGLEIRLAKLDSRGDELVDTFFVRSGAALAGPELRDLARSIENSISA